jgi:hypothetical protein
MIIIVLAVFFKVLTLFEGLQILITYTLVLVTAQYAKSASEQAKANIKMAEEMGLSRKIHDTPTLIAYFDNPQSILLDLVIKNIGYGIAKDVKLKIDPPLYDHNNRDIAELSLFKQGINFFPPNREFRQIIGVSTQFFGKGSQRPLEYNLTISYSDVAGKPIPPQTIPLDLSVYRDLPIHRESDVDKLTKEVKNLAQKLSAMRPG